MSIVLDLFIDLLDKNPRPTITAPQDFVHHVHVGFDPKTGEFTVSQIEDA